MHTRFTSNLVCLVSWKLQNGKATCDKYAVRWNLNPTIVGTLYGDKPYTKVV